MCQTTGTSPLIKYETDGGPGRDRILGLLASSGDRESDRVNFFRAQLLFWLLCAPDCHAKNFSIHLAPRGKNPHRNMRDVLRRHWNESARRNGIGDSPETIMAELFDKTPQVIEQVACKLPKQFPAYVADSLFSGLRDAAARLARMTK